MSYPNPARGPWPGVPTDVAERLDVYLRTAEKALSANTLRALNADLTLFASWCGERGLCALPSSSATVAGFVDAMAAVRSPATVRRYVASIALAHRVVGKSGPLKSVAVRLALQRMHRRKGRRQKQALGLTWALRQRLLSASGDRPIDARNRAMLAVAYDALLRRSELVSVQVAEVVEELPGYATLLVSRGKTDPQGDGAVVYLARDTVALVREWRARGAVDDGRLFRSVTRGGAVGERLHASQVPRIFKGMARRAGLPEELVAGLSGHSARVGAAQDMVACGIEMPAILQAGRWKTSVMVNRYGERLLARRSGSAQLARAQRRE